MRIGEALSVLKDGGCVARHGWNGKGLFIFRQVPATIGMTIVPKMQSLPQSVKDEFIKRFESSSNPAHTVINYDNQLALVDKDNKIQGWSSSTPDALAEDWYVVHQPVD